MTDDHSANQFHAPEGRFIAGNDDLETLRDLVGRLGTPPKDVVEAWRASSGETLPQEFRHWDLDQLAITPSATLVRLKGLSEVAEIAKPPTNSVVGPREKSESLVSKSSSGGKFKRYQTIVLVGLFTAMVGIIYSAARPVTQNAEISQNTARSSGSDIFAPGRSRSVDQDDVVKPVTRDDSASIPRPSTEPLETLSLIENNSEAEMSTSAVTTPSINLVDPLELSVNGLIPPVQSESPSSTSTKPSKDRDDLINPLLKPTPLVASAIAPAESVASSPPATMDEVLATGEDAPPSENLQPIRSADIDLSGNESAMRVLADPLPISIETSDQHPTWDLKQPIPTTGVRLAITFDLPEGINEGWIEPVDETSPRRMRAVAIITPENEESVAIGLRLDIRCNAKLSVRMRFAARLDPTLPWQMVSRETLLKSIDYVGSQSTLASAQLAQIEAFYSKADSAQKRSIRDQRDAARIQVEQFKLVLTRLAELRTLADKLETDGRLMIHLSHDGPDGNRTLLETVRQEAESLPEAQAAPVEEEPAKQNAAKPAQ